MFLLFLVATSGDNQKSSGRVWIRNEHGSCSQGRNVYISYDNKPTEVIHWRNHMKPHLPVFLAVVVYYCLTSIFFFWKIDSFTKDILIAPLYFIVPAGVGLLLLSPGMLYRRISDVTGTGAYLLASAFIGMVSVTLLYQDLQRLQFLTSAFPYLYFLVKLLSLIGYYRARVLLMIEPARLKAAALMLLWLAPVAFLAYYLVFMHFASFPLRDIFQETHFMKGAHELSRFQVLNPFITSSYLSVIQVHLGLLNHFYQYDLLNSQWILPAYTYLFHLACYAVFFSILLPGAKNLRFALALATLLAPMFYIENMVILESISLVFFAALVRSEKTQTNVREAWVPGLWLMAFFLIYQLYFNYLFADHGFMSGKLSPYSGMWIFTLLLLYLVGRFQLANMLHVAFLTLLAISMFAFHRGIIIVFPAILFMYLVHVAIFRTRLLERPGHRLALFRTVVIGFSLFAATILLVDYHLTDIPSGNHQWSSSIALRVGEILLRTDVLVGSGTGFNHSLVEYLRLSSPAVLLFTFTMIMGFVFYRVRPALVPHGVVSQTKIIDSRMPSLNYVLFLVLTITPLVLVALSTIPYAYRGAYFPAVLTILLLVVLVGFWESVDAASDRRLPSRALVLLACVATLYGHLVLYDFSINFVTNANSYLTALSPLPQVILLLLILTAVAVFWFRPPQQHAYGLVLFSIIAAIIVDATSFRTMFYDKAYGAELPASRVISHYTALELELGKSLRSAPAKTVLVSDPYTLSILRAVTGLNSAYSFANINLVTDPTPYQMMFRDLATLGRHDRREEYAKLAGWVKYLRTESAGEAMYIWNLQRTSKQSELVSISDVFENYRWVIGAKTLKWAFGDDSYYPDNAPLSSDLISVLSRYFEIVSNQDSRLIVLKLRYSDEMYRSISLGFKTDGKALRKGRAIDSE